MTDPASDLFEPPCLTTLTGLLPRYPEVGRTCVVGGAVRDALLGHQPVDFDFTTEHDPTPLARAFAKQCGGNWFWLDEQRRQSRVGIAGGTYDFAPWRAPSLADDLAARDFTINAMALDLAGPLIPAALIDPLGGRDDLSARILCCAGPNVLGDDPLRVLKGIRHAVELELAIAPATLQAMQAVAGQLRVSAPERLRLEIWRILAAPAACRGIRLLVDCGAGDALFGRDFGFATAIVQSTLQRADLLFAALADDSVAAAWLHDPVEQGLDRGTLLRWSLALGAIKHDLPLMVAYRWRFSRTALSRIASLQKLTPQLWQELLNLPRRPRPVALWALQHSPDPIDLLLALGLLERNETAAVRDMVAPILRLLADLPDTRRVPPLVDGRWLQEVYGLEGPELGVILGEVRRAEIYGIISNVEEARRYLAGRVPKNG